MQLVALMASKISGGAVAIDRANFTEQCGFLCSFSKSIPHIGSNPVSQKVELRKSSKGHCFSVGLCFSSESFWNISGKPYSYLLSRKHIVLCCSAGTRSSEAKECLMNSEDYTDVSRYELLSSSTNQPFIVVIRMVQGNFMTSLIRLPQGLLPGTYYVVITGKQERLTKTILIQ